MTTGGTVAIRLDFKHRSELEYRSAWVFIQSDRSESMSIMHIIIYIKQEAGHEKTKTAIQAVKRATANGEGRRRPDHEVEYHMTS